MSNDKNCFFCNTKCEIYTTPKHHLLNTYRCDFCGEYILPEDGLGIIYDIQHPSDKFKITCILNERRLKGLGGIVLSNKTDKEEKICGYPQVSVEDILNEFPNKASEFITRSLINLSKLAKLPFDRIELSLEPMGKYYIFSQEGEQADTFLRELENQGWIFSCNDTNNWEFWVFTLTTKSWEMIENFTANETDSKRVFVAMWFHESMNDFYKDGIEKAVKDAGYVPIRIDLKDFNEKICDEIIAEIKRCKFLISDFSGQRGGVYYEAGFAKGLGKPVIFTVKKDHVEKLHFDTRQYNHIVYDSPEELHKKLYNRICATIV